MKESMLSAARRINNSLKQRLPISIRQLLLRYEGLVGQFFFVPDYGFPKIVGIEATNRCNLRCNHCPSHDGSSPRREGFMEESLFNQLIKEISEKSSTKHIELHKDGEPLIHPEIPEFVKSAKGIGLKIKLTTNGLLMKPDIATKIFESKIDEVEFSIGAADPGTYHKVRGGNLNRLESTINEAIRIREELQNPLTTRFIFQIIRTVEINDKEISRFKKKWSTVPHSTIFIKDYVNWAGAFPGHDAHMKRYPCGQLWIYPSINWNGNVSACCQDWKEELIIGNVSQKSIEEIWSGEKLRGLRKMHIDASIPPAHPCYECNGWSFMSRMFHLKV